MASMLGRARAGVPAQQCDLVVHEMLKSLCTLTFGMKMMRKGEEGCEVSPAPTRQSTQASKLRCCRTRCAQAVSKLPTAVAGEVVERMKPRDAVALCDVEEEQYSS